MKKLLLLLSVFTTIISYTQTRGYSGSTFAGSDGVPHDMQFRDADGNLILIGDHPDVTGSPMLNDSSGYAVIKFRNGKNIADSFINYSLFDHKLFYFQNGKYYSINDPVKEFSISFPSNPGSKALYKFKTGYPFYNKNDNATIYEVLFEGNALQLLKWQHKKIEVSEKYASAPEKEFVSIQDYYAFLPKENRMIELGIKLNLNELKKSLPTYTAQIDAYESAHKINAKKEDNWIQLFAYLDK